MSGIWESLVYPLKLNIFEKFQMHCVPMDTWDMSNLKTYTIALGHF